MKKLNIIGNIRKFNRWGPLIDEDKPIDIKESLTNLFKSLLLLIAIFTPLLAILQFITTCIEVIYNKTLGSKERKKVINKLLKYADKIEKDIGLLYLENHEYSTKWTLYSLYEYYKPSELFEYVHEPNLDMFIYMYMNKYNWHCDTIYANNNTFQCESGKRRSIGDLYLLCKYYHKDITIINVIESLIRLSNKGFIHSSRCNTIHKYVFTQGTQCYNGKLEMFDDTLTWNELVKILKDK